jgi:hypothetical protein
MTMLPTDYTNDTASFDLHPDAHNDTNAAVNQLGAGRRGPVGYWTYAWPSAAATTQALTADQVKITRIAMEQPFDGAVIEVTAFVASSTALIGVYNVDVNGLPTTLAASGSVATDTNGVKQVTFTAVPAGLHWFAVKPSAAITTRSSGSLSPLMLHTSTGSMSGFNAWTLQLGTGAALPNPWPGGHSTHFSMVVAMLRFA